MGIFQRISDIISANLNDLIDEYEDPEKLLKQVVHEMEEAIAVARPDVAKAMATEKTLAKELADNQAQIQTWTERAERAVQSGDDELARKAIVRRREYESIVAALRDEHASSREASQTLRRQLEAMQAKLKEAERRLGSLAARKRAADVRARAASSASESPELERNAFDKFDRLAKKVERAEAEADALAELSRSEGRTDAFGDEAGAAESDVEKELAALKTRMQSDSGQPGSN